MENIQIKIEALKLKHARKLKQCDLVQSNLQIAVTTRAVSSVMKSMKALDQLFDDAIDIESQIEELGTQI